MDYLNLKVMAIIFHAEYFNSIGIAVKYGFINNPYFTTIYTI